MFDQFFSALSTKMESDKEMASQPSGIPSPTNQHGDNTMGTAIYNVDNGNDSADKQELNIAEGNSAQASPSDDTALAGMHNDSPSPTDDQSSENPVPVPSNELAFMMVPIESIVEWEKRPKQARNPTRYSLLRESIKVHGLNDPLKVHRKDDGSNMLTVGYDELEICKEHEYKEIPILLTGKAPLQDWLDSNLLQEAQPLMVIAEAFQMAFDRKIFPDQEALGQAYGYKPSSISEYLSLNRFPEPVKAVLREDFTRKYPFRQLKRMAAETDVAKRVLALFQQHAEGDASSERFNIAKAFKDVQGTNPAQAGSTDSDEGGEEIPQDRHPHIPDVLDEIVQSLDVAIVFSSGDADTHSLDTDEKWQKAEDKCIDFLIERCSRHADISSTASDTRRQKFHELFEAARIALGIDSSLEDNFDAAKLEQSLEQAAAQ